jgi:hypothetical protein
MKRSIFLIVAFMSLTKSSLGELIAEDICFYCPPGSDIQLPDPTTDRYY